MRRSSGSIWQHGGAAAALVPAVLAILAMPVRAGGPAPVVLGGGDDPAITVTSSAADGAAARWKVDEASRLQAAVKPASRLPSGARPAFLAPPCEGGCPPSEVILDSYARQQITGYDCGPATAQMLINRTRGYAFAAPGGEAVGTNYRKQSVIADFMGTDADGSSAGMVRAGLNHFADLDASGRHVPFTVFDGISSGSDFHWAMVVAIWDLGRGAAVPVQMTLSSQHLASWSSATWWNRFKTATIRHWIGIYGYSGFWDGTYGPQLFFTDSAGGYGGQTGTFRDASRLVYSLNQANSARIVY